MKVNRLFSYVKPVPDQPLGIQGKCLTGCLHLLEILEISWNLIGPAGNCLCKMSKIDRIGFQS